MKNTILIVDDDPEFVTDLEFLLKDEYSFLRATNEQEALTSIKKNSPDIVLLDLVLERENGIDILKKIKSEDSALPIIMITEHSSIDTAIEAIKIGADNYVAKNLNVKELKALINKSLSRKLDTAKSRTLMAETYRFYEEIIGESAVIKQVIEKIKLAAQGDFTVVIQGESGSGKELAARQIHKLSARSNEIFIAVNCGALPEQLIESELFGYEKGAFTGANKRKLGKFEIASNGTIFLDEIAELKLDSQVKLMRVLQNKEFERLGGSAPILTNARVIAATNKNLFDLMEKGKFREDLYYRLEVFPIYLPPLRERKEDIPLLIDYFLDLRSRELNVKKPAIRKKTMEVFLNYDWPGNIRELDNIITRLLILSRGGGINENLVYANLQPQGNNQLKFNAQFDLNWKSFKEAKRKAAKVAVNEIEKIFVEKILKQFDGNITQAAKNLNVDRSTLHRLIARVNSFKNKE